MAIPLETLIRSRGLHSGPQVGAYLVWTVSGHDLIAAELAQFSILPAFDFRIVETAVIANSNTGSTAQYRIANGATNVVLTRNWPASDVAEILTPASGLVAAARSGVRSKGTGTSILIELDSNGTGVLLDWSVMITAYVQAHAVQLVGDSLMRQGGD